jgi:hypothetical protein
LSNTQATQDWGVLDPCAQKIVLKPRDITVNTLGWSTMLGGAVGTSGRKCSRVCPFTGKDFLERHVLALELLRIISSYRITTVIVVLLQGK